MKNTKHAPGSATDDTIPGQFLWSDGWLYKGLATFARVLEETNHPEANHWRREAALKWFREGPQTKYWRFDGCCWQTPVLHHEMSSCEPLHSWNMDLSFLRCDRERFIEGLHAQFAGARTAGL